MDVIEVLVESKNTELKKFMNKKRKSKTLLRPPFIRVVWIKNVSFKLRIFFIHWKGKSTLKSILISGKEIRSHFCMEHSGSVISRLLFSVYMYKSLWIIIININYWHTIYQYDRVLNHREHSKGLGLLHPSLQFTERGIFLYGFKSPRLLQWS